MERLKNIVFFYYDGFVEFEIAMAYFYLSHHHVRSVAFEQREYRSMEGQRFLPDATIDSIHPNEIDLIVIPGGNPLSLLRDSKLRHFIDGALAENAIVAGICGGVDILVSMGYLSGRRCISSTNDPTNPAFLEQEYRETIASMDDVVSESNFITAKGESYREFARELAFRLGMQAQDLPF
jgi:putative intracellular protease/amidase